MKINRAISKLITLIKNPLQWQFHGKNVNFLASSTSAAIQHSLIIDSIGPQYIAPVIEGEPNSSYTYSNLLSQNITTSSIPTKFQFVPKNVDNNLLVFTIMTIYKGKTITFFDKAFILPVTSLSSITNSINSGRVQVTVDSTGAQSYINTPITQYQTGNYSVGEPLSHIDQIKDGMTVVFGEIMDGLTPSQPPQYRLNFCFFSQVPAINGQSNYYPNFSSDSGTKPPTTIDGAFVFKLEL